MALVIAVAAILTSALLFSRGCAPRDSSPTAARLPAPSGIGVDRDDSLDAGPERTVEDVPARVTASEPSATAPTPRLMMYECGDVFFATRTIPGETMLFAPQLLGNEPLTLEQTEASSGERYTAGDTVFWNKGSVATFELRGQVFVDCTANLSRSLQAQAQARGVIVWATGNQPSWILEITPEQLILTTESGSRRRDFPYGAPTANGLGTNYPSIIGTYRSVVGTQEIIAIVDEHACNDSLSGEAFPVTVAVTFEQRTLYGCGQIFPLNVPRSQ